MTSRMPSGAVRMTLTSVMRRAGTPPLGSHGWGTTGSGNEAVRLRAATVSRFFLRGKGYGKARGRLGGNGAGERVAAADAGGGAADGVRDGGSAESAALRDGP